MAIYLYSSDSGHIPPFEYLPCGAIHPKAGLPMQLTAGKLTLAAGSVKPQYISVLEGDKSHGSYEDELIPVIRINSDLTFTAPAAASMAAILPGDKVTLSADGLSLTATKTGGIAEIVGYDGTDAGSQIRFRLA